MAYKGGIYTKPIVTKVQENNQFLMNATSRIAEIRKGILDARAEQSTALATAIGNIQSTGVEDQDKLWFQTGSLAKDQLYQAHLLIDNGEMTLTEGNALQTSLLSQMNNFGVITEARGKQMEELTKAVADKKVSGASLQSFKSNWFQPSGGPSQIYGVDSNTGKETVMDAHNSFAATMIDGNYVFLHQYSDVDPETGEHKLSLNYVKPGNLAKQANLIDYWDQPQFIQDWKKSIGNKFLPPDYRDRLELGDMTVWQTHLDVNQIPEIRRDMESNIAAIVSDDNQVAAFFVDVLGAKAAKDTGFTRMKNNIEIQNAFGNLPDENGNTIGVLHVKDSKGNPTDRFIDPTFLTYDEQGRYKISPYQRQVMAAYLRADMNNALGSKLFEKNEGNDPTYTGTGPSKWEPTVSRYNKLENGKINTNAPLDGQWLKNTIALSNIFRDRASGTAMVEYGKSRADHMNGKALEITDIPAILEDRFDDVVGGITFSMTKKGKNADLAGGLLLGFDEADTLYKRKLDNIQQMLYLEEGTSEDRVVGGETIRGERKAPMIVLVGTSSFMQEGASVTGVGAAPSQDGGATIPMDTSAKTTNMEEVSTNLMFVTSENIAQFYGNMWTTNIGFNEYMESQGYNQLGQHLVEKDGKTVKEQDYWKALRLFFDNYQNQ